MQKETLPSFVEVPPFSEPIHLAYHPKFESIQEALSESSLEEVNMAEVFYKTGLFENGNYDPDTLQGALGEIYFNSVLERFVDGETEVVLDPIQSGSESENFSFEYNRVMGNLVAKNKRTGDDVTEYDRLISITDGEEEFPVIFEVKVDNGMQRRHRSSLSVRGKNDEIQRVAAPIGEFFDTDEIGYVAVVPRGRVFGAQRFVRAGGNIMTFPFTHSEFLVECLRTKMNEKL